MGGETQQEGTIITLEERKGDYLFDEKGFALSVLGGDEALPGAGII